MTDIPSPDVRSTARLLSIEQVAEALNMSIGWVRKGVLERTLPHTKIGRSIRFTPEHIEQIIAAGERPPIQRPDHAPGRGSARTRL